MTDLVVTRKCTDKYKLLLNVCISVEQSSALEMKKEYAVLGRWDFVLMRKKKFYERHGRKLKDQAQS